MIWQDSDIQDDKHYKLQLCQSEGGKRYFSLACSSDGSVSNKDVYRTTEIVPNKLLRRGDLIAIAEEVLLEGKDKYYVDSHGIWFMEDEVIGLRKGMGFDEISWVTGRAPKLPNS